MGVLKEESLNILVDEINRNVNTKINAIKVSDKATDINMSDGTTVEVSVNKNKSDIADINTHLNKSENTKYNTVNGVKEFECKDGYVDNILIEGKTLMQTPLKSNLLIGQRYEIGSISYGQSSGNDEVDESKYRTVGYIEIDASKQYKIYTDKLNNTYSPSPYYYFYYDTNKSYITRSDSANITPPSNAKYIRFYEHIGGTLTQDRVNDVKCMMFESQYAPPFSPNMDYYEPILESVGQGDKIEILTRKHGSNLYNNNATYGKSILASGGITDNAEWCIIDSLYVEKNKTYTIEKGSSAGIGDNIGYIYVYEFNFDGSYSSKRHDLGLGKNTFTPSKNCFIKISIKYTNLEGFGVYDSGLRLPYTTDKKQILTTLRSLPNGVKDAIEKRGNKYYKIQRVVEVDVYDAIKKYNLEVVIEKENETTSKPMIKNFVTALGGKVDGNNFNVHCSHFKVANIYQDTITEEGMYLTTHMHNRILKSKVVGLQGVVSKNAMLAWYRTNKVKVVFELAEPIITELPNLNLRTFSPQTTLFVDSGIVQADISFDVTNTLGSSIDAMADKIGSLEDMLGGQLEIGTERINSLLRKMNG